LGFEPKKDEVKRLISGIVTKNKEKEKENEPENDNSNVIDLNEFM
jgi:hypothetical protein